MLKFSRLYQSTNLRWYFLYPHFKLPSFSRPQPKQQPGPFASFVASFAPARQICHIWISRQSLRNLPARLDPPNHDQPVSSLRHGLGDRVRALGLPLRPNHVGLPLLLRLLDDEPTPLSVLLRDLLLFNGAGEFLAEGHVRDGDVLERDVELGGAAEEVRADAGGDGLPLRDELGGVELGDDGFEDFIADGGEDALVVVETEVLVGGKG